MADVTLDPALFRQLFPEFAANPPNTDAVIQFRWDEAALYVTTENCGDLIDARRQHAVMLMTAHLMRLAVLLAAAPAGEPATPGVVTGATIDKVSVTLQPPPSRNEWGYWLNQTPYGQQLLAYLRVQSVGGFYVGGLPERDAFRKVYGVW
jgi:hypothetical protein